MLRNAIAIEHAKLFRRRLLWIELAVLAGLFLLFSVSVYSISLRDAEAGPFLQNILLWPSGLYTGAQVGGSTAVAGTLLIILVGAIVGQEYGWRTLHLLLGHGLPRVAYIAAKFVAILTATALFVGVAMVVGGIISVVLTIALQGGIDLGQVEWGRALLMGAVAGYGLLPYGALALMLAVITRSVVAPIGMGLAFALAGETLLVQFLLMTSGALSNVARFMPTKAAQSLARSVQPAATLEGGLSVNGQRLASPEFLDPFWAAAVIALYVLVFVAVSVWALRRQDLSG